MGCAGDCALLRVVVAIDSLVLTISLGLGLGMRSREFDELHRTSAVEPEVCLALGPLLERLFWATQIEAGELRCSSPEPKMWSNSV